MGYKIAVFTPKLHDVNYLSIIQAEFGMARRPFPTFFRKLTLKLFQMIDAKGGLGRQEDGRLFTMSFCAQDTKKE